MLTRQQDMHIAYKPHTTLPNLVHELTLVSEKVFSWPWNQGSIHGQKGGFLFFF